jgi:ERCC4-related helicase
MDAIRARLKTKSVLMVRGGEPLLTTRPKVDIVLIQTSAGIGIDLSYAQTIIFYSWDYSFINYEQMRFRVLSRSQTTARYIFLMINNSIDEAIYQAAVRKKKLSVAINDFYRS